VKVVKALEGSLFHPLSKELKELLIGSGVVPVNDIFLPIWEDEPEVDLFSIILLYGSYGSGKSVFIVDKLIKKAIENPYFRCYYGRKVFDTVRGTVFQTIVDRIRETKKDHLFYFSSAPNGSMVITCRESGNQFIPFGANDAQSLKSIKDPTDFYCEEMDQFSFDDFGILYSRLRTEKAETKFWGAFNTDRIYQSHWIRKTFFEGEFSGKAFKQKANYYHNYFIDQQAYYDKLKLTAGGNIAKLNAIAEGEWGVVRTGDEFWKQFDESRHVKKVDLDMESTIHVSLDENVNPYVTDTVWQVSMKDKKIKQVHEILSESPDNNAPKAAMQLVKWLRSINYQGVVFVYGDPSARRRSTVDENSASFFDKFIEVLIKNGYRVSNRVQKSAPQVATSAAFINDIYESGYEGWSIEISDKCFRSIEDYILVKEDAEGKMAKPKEKDEESKVRYEPRGHISDTKRYFIITILKKQFELYKKPKQITTGVTGFFH
jgi:PBSX family phage terminase large subunit